MNESVNRAFSGCSNQPKTAAKRYVKHVSGIGQKWELTDDGRGCNENMKNPAWAVWEEPGSRSPLFLPKSEYVLCEPAKRWVDVTEDCQVNQGNDIIIRDGVGIMSILRGNDITIHDWVGIMSILDADVGYRVRKIRCSDCKHHGGSDYQYRDAFIIEQRQEVPE